MSSSRKRRDNSSHAESKKAKQQKNDHRNDLLSKYFLEEEFKTKFTKAFRFVLKNDFCLQMCMHGFSTKKLHCKLILE